MGLRPLPEREVSSPTLSPGGPQARQKNDEWMSALRDIHSELGVQGTSSPAGARGVLAHSLLPGGPQARQKNDEWISGSHSLSGDGVSNPGKGIYNAR